MLELTSSEVSSLPKDTKVYEGVGKMYVLSFLNSNPDNVFTCSSSFQESTLHYNLTPSPSKLSNHERREHVLMIIGLYALQSQMCKRG
jgi:hypothetical protein